LSVVSVAEIGEVYGGGCWRGYSLVFSREQKLFANNRNESEKIGHEALWMLKKKLPHRRLVVCRIGETWGTAASVPIRS
jgi:hypothetical protein